MVRHGVARDVLAGALERALFEAGANGKDIETSEKELRSTLLGLVLWAIFGRESTLWISSRTEAGDEVPTELMVIAFAMWAKAVRFADRYRVDSDVAAEALMSATHATAERLRRIGKDKESREIRNYLFAAYMYRINHIARRQGSNRTDGIDDGDWRSDRKVSDKGAFCNVVESGIYWNEILDAMPPRGRGVAMARYIFGNSWDETAGAFGSSVNAAQKALSTGIRKALGACRRDVRRAQLLPRSKRRSKAGV
jgi:DNA-directed RNA polymerase specialized sigma24 family protein